MSAVEGGQESIALGLHDATVVVGKEPLDQQMMVADELRPALWTQPRGERTGIANVAQHQGEGSVR